MLLSPCLVVASLFVVCLRANPASSDPPRRICMPPSPPPRTTGAPRRPCSAPLEIVRPGVPFTQVPLPRDRALIDPAAAAAAPRHLFFLAASASPGICFRVWSRRLRHRTRGPIPDVACESSSGVPCGVGRTTHGAPSTETPPTPCRHNQPALAVPAGAWQCQRGDDGGRARVELGQGIATFFEVV